MQMLKVAGIFGAGLQILAGCSAERQADVAVKLQAGVAAVDKYVVVANQLVCEINRSGAGKVLVGLIDASVTVFAAPAAPPVILAVGLSDTFITAVCNTAGGTPAPASVAAGTVLNSLVAVTPPASAVVVQTAPAGVAAVAAQ